MKALVLKEKWWDKGYVAKGESLTIALLNARLKWAEGDDKADPVSIDEDLEKNSKTAKMAEATYKMPIIAMDWNWSQQS